MQTRDYEKRTSILVVDLEGMVVGLIVDTVQEVRGIAAGEVSAPPKLASAEKARYSLGMGKVGSDVKTLLDVQKLLREEDVDALSA